MDKGWTSWVLNVRVWDHPFGTLTPGWSELSEDPALRGVVTVCADISTQVFGRELDNRKQTSWITMWSSCWSPCSPGGAQEVMLEPALPLWHSQRKVSGSIFSPAPNTVSGCSAVEIHLSPLLCFVSFLSAQISLVGSVAGKLCPCFWLFCWFFLLTHSLSMTTPNEGLTKTKESYSK